VTMRSAMPPLMILVPTRNEADNVFRYLQLLGEMRWTLWRRHPVRAGHPGEPETQLAA
jgi:hypothetical protein